MNVRTLILASALCSHEVMAQDARIQTLHYEADQVYSLQGHAGYQIDVQFGPDEHLVGLGAGDIEAVQYAAQENHVFLKPKAIDVHTNLTVLTNVHTYYFDYVVPRPSSDTQLQDMVYAVRFLYPSAPLAQPGLPSAHALLQQPESLRSRNLDYWFCGDRSIAPVSAWDDGIHVHLRFRPGGELPALFVHNDDGSESLLNFDVQNDEVVIHRVVGRLVARRGKLSGCIVNRSLTEGEVLESGTVRPEVRRETRPADDALAP